MPSELSQEQKRQVAAEKIAAILEEAMNDMGLTDDQKDAKVAEMAAIALRMRYTASAGCLSCVQ